MSSCVQCHVPRVKVCYGVGESHGESSVPEEMSHIPHPCAVSSQRPFVDNDACPFHVFPFTSMFLLLNIWACSECLYQWFLWSYAQLSVPLNNCTGVWSHFWVTEKLGATGYLLNQEELGWQESCDKFNTYTHTQKPQYIKFNTRKTNIMPCPWTLEQQQPQKQDK